MNQIPQPPQSSASNQPDHFGRFFREELIFLAPNAGGARTPFREIYRAYQVWCSTQDEQPRSTKRLGSQLRLAGGESRYDGHGYRTYGGVLPRVAADSSLRSIDDDERQRPPAHQSAGAPTPTFDLLYQAEWKATGHSKRAYMRALADWAFLQTVSAFDKPLLPVPQHTLKVRRAALRRAGIAPLVAPEDLAALATDLKVRTETELVRLLWVLNDDKSQSFVAAARRWWECQSELAPLGGTLTI